MFTPYTYGCQEKGLELLRHDVARSMSLLHLVHEMSYGRSVSGKHPESPARRYERQGI
jgi:hypothetical protein